MWKPVWVPANPRQSPVTPGPEPVQLGLRTVGAARGSCMSGPGCPGSAEADRRLLRRRATIEHRRVRVAALHQRRSRREYRQQAVGHPVDGVPLQLVESTRSPAPMPQRGRPAAGVGQHLGHRRARQRGCVPGHRVPRRELVAVQPDLRCEVDDARRQPGMPLPNASSDSATIPSAGSAARARSTRPASHSTHAAEAGRRPPPPRTTTPPAAPPPSASARAAARPPGCPARRRTRRAAGSRPSPPSSPW